MQPAGLGGVRGGRVEAETSAAEAVASPDGGAPAAAPVVRGGAPSGRMAAQVATQARAQASAHAPEAAPSADEGRLLPKKAAGEKALLLHLDGRVGPKYEAKVIPGADRDHYTVKLLRLSASPPFAPASEPEAVYTFDRRTGALTRADAPAPAGKGGAALGELARPGRALAGTTRALGHGEAITLRTRENQIFGLGEIKVEPRGAVEVTRRMLEGAPAGRLGGSSLYEYEVRLAPGTPPGTEAKVTTSGHFQTRHDPDWAFTFRVVAEK